MNGHSFFLYLKYKLYFKFSQQINVANFVNDLGNDTKGGDEAMKMKKHPSKAGVSAASVKGNAGPTVERDGGGKKTSQNQQYGKENMGNE
ncbi:hypothetical protein AF6_2377 [Anoxybacillus flavithermus TNO-09.006]|nr:hypothetical protein AF6_2377 [Anoxybacillus flavithermus TNO-09.006]